MWDLPSLLSPPPLAGRSLAGHVTVFLRSHPGSPGSTLAKRVSSLRLSPETAPNKSRARAHGQRTPGLRWYSLSLFPSPFSQKRP